MSRRVLLVEPDAAGRAVMNRALTAHGCAVEAVASILDARALLDQSPPVELAIVDEFGGSGEALGDVRWIRRHYPRVPVVVTGALLSTRVMRELLRLRVVDALAKPFTPEELREAVARALADKGARHDDALEYAAAIAAARRAIVEGRLAEAAPALRRAQATSPLDAEVTALWALVAELEGRDDDADRGYRAALALRREEDAPPPDPHEGLARVEAYAGANPVDALRSAWAGAPLWIVTDPATELRAPSPVNGAGCVVVSALGLTSEGTGAVFFRDSPGPRAFALMTGAMRPETIAQLVARLGPGPIVVSESSRARLDLDRVAALCGAAVTR